MSNDDHPIQVESSSGNIFADLGLPDAQLLLEISWHCRELECGDFVGIVKEIKNTRLPSETIGQAVERCKLAMGLMPAFGIAGPQPSPRAARRAADGLRAAYGHADAAGSDADRK